MAGYNSKNHGFSLIEMLVVMAIIAFVAGGLVINFRSTAVNGTGRRQAVQAFINDIRDAQSKTLSGSAFKGAPVCGYGIHYIDQNSYVIYAKSPPGAGTCRASVSTRNYTAGQDVVVATKKLTNTNMKFQASFNDFYFEMPESRTYLDNNYLLKFAVPIPITIVPTSGTGNTTITIYLSGRIDTTEQ